MRTIGKLLNEVENPVSLSGHTDAIPYAGGAMGGYSNWELSTERANSSRRELVQGGMDPNKILRVQGLGAVVPLDKTNPNDPMNRRIAIVVLNEAAQVISSSPGLARQFICSILFSCERKISDDTSPMVNTAAARASAFNKHPCQ